GKILLTTERKWEGKGEQTEFTGYAVNLRDATTGKVVRTVHEGSQSPVALFSSDGNTMVTLDYPSGHDPSIEIGLRDATTGKVKSAINAGAQLLFSIALSPDGRRIVGGGPTLAPNGETSGGVIVCWDVTTGKMLWQAKEHRNQVNRVAFS